MKKEGDESEDSQRTIIKTFAKVYKKEGFGSEGRKEQGENENGIIHISSISMETGDVKSENNSKRNMNKLLEWSEMKYEMLSKRSDIGGG